MCALTCYGTKVGQQCVCPRLHALCDLQEAVRGSTSHQHRSVMQAPLSRDTGDDTPDGGGQAQLGIPHGNVEVNQQHLWMGMGGDVSTGEGIDEGWKGTVVYVVRCPRPALAEGVR